MCGIAAILKSINFACPDLTLTRMRDEVAYRGPDDQGNVFFKRRDTANWIEVSASGSAWEVGLAHRRLSILDLSPAGHQPMVYRDRFWIIFNGEVYNFIELRTELERLGHVFCSSSDTEVILAAYSEWGTACFQRFRGMWGMVIFDQTRNEVILCRDRLGIKPLYYFDRPGMIAVSSEIKQFQHVPGFIPSTDPVTVTQYLKTGYEDPSRCFFREVHPVEAGTWLRIRLDRLQLS
jgi:asparagine synthase (glutamine-hydrolysing)